MDGSRRRDWPTHVVGCHHEVIGFGPGSDLLGLRDASTCGGVGLHDVASLPFEQFPELMPCVDAFASRDRNRYVLADPLQSFDVVGRHRLLDPCRTKPLEIARQGNRCGWRESAVPLDHQFGVRTDCVPNSLDHLQGMASLFRVELVRTLPAGVDLDGPIALLDDPPGRRTKLLRGSLDRVPTVGVHLTPSPPTPPPPFFYAPS